MKKVIFKNYLFSKFAELVKLQQLKVVGLMTIPAFNLSLIKKLQRLC